MTKNKVGLWTLLIVLTTLTAFSYSDSFHLVKRQIGFSDNKHTNPTTVPSVLNLAKGNDGGVYMLLGQSLLERMKISSPEKVEEKLRNWQLEKNLSEGSFDSYIAHQNRLRLAYSFLAGMFSIFFGIFGFLLFNCILLVLLFREIYILSKENSVIFFVAAGVLAISPIPQRIWVATPDLFLTFLISVLVRYLLLREPKQKNLSRHRDQFYQSLKSGPILVLILNILLNLTKPLFLILGFLFAAIIFLERGKKIWSWINFGVNLFFAFIWVWMKKYGFTAAELLNSEATTRNITGWKTSIGLQPPVESATKFYTESVSPTLGRMPKVTMSELNYAITQNISFMFIILIVPIIVLFTFKIWNQLVCLVALGIGSLLSQSWSGGLGVNYRFLLPYIFVSIVLSSNVFGILYSSELNRKSKIDNPK